MLLNYLFKEGEGANSRLNFLSSIAKKETNGKKKGFNAPFFYECFFL